MTGLAAAEAAVARRAGTPALRASSPAATTLFSDLMRFPQAPGPAERALGGGPRLSPRAARRSARTWRPVVTEWFGQRFRCLAFDLPGHGSSAPLAEDNRPFGSWGAP